jgi:hypothetical protein
MSDKLMAVEKQIGLQLLDKLENDSITVERASEISTQVIDIIGGKNDEDTYLKLVDLIKTFPEFSYIHDSL